jgi:hypothetical protein
MCIACEMAFWMEVEEAERVAALRKAQLSRTDETFACDAPEPPINDAPSASSKAAQDERSS